MNMLKNRSSVFTGFFVLNNMNNPTRHKRADYNCHPNPGLSMGEGTNGFLPGLKDMLQLIIFL
ncbi:hypothetical protein MHA01_31320 [Marinococcus halophilus]|uniref:Uncharacterized protein n=1 Tax=Marinococcus halophilus TaxID=1371 RepID=A0A510YCZ4_MARHA|nr:hypothetical protein MHA01_31320 [Marinococcus halophilus]